MKLQFYNEMRQRDTLPEGLCDLTRKLKEYVTTPLPLA